MNGKLKLEITVERLQDGWSAEAWITEPVKQMLMGVRNYAYARLALRVLLDDLAKEGWTINVTHALHTLDNPKIKK